MLRDVLSFGKDQTMQFPLFSQSVREIVNNSENCMRARPIHSYIFCHEVRSKFPRSSVITILTNNVWLAFGQFFTLASSTVAAHFL
jgi:hypothetical protein